MSSKNSYLIGIAAFCCGLLFSLGLVVSGMANPAKVLNFLDVLGNWDPSLAFVMGGAVAVTGIGFRVVTKRSSPALFSNFSLPTRIDVDKPLIVGAILFGIGWGVGGYCPGPAWTSLSAMAPGTLVFISTMAFGMWLTSWMKNRSN